MLGAAIAVVAAAGSTHALASPQPGLRALPPNPDGALHVARRLSYGATPALVAQLREVGLAAWLERQLADGPDQVGPGAAPGTTTAPLPVVVLQQVQAKGRNPVRDLQVATFARAVWADRQVYELMVEFWSNHLSIAAAVPAVGVHKVIDDRDVVRPHALGSFSDLLVASSQSPAMLRYLSNASSQGSKPNENYARELLELHTVGVHGGYTRRDVRDAALVLTGLTVDDSTGLFIFRPEWHATGRVQVLGWSNDNAAAGNGLAVATSLLRYLARHPQTAKNLATKLVRRFVSDTPPAGLVSSAARVYLAGDTAIAPVLTHIVLSREFASSAGRKTQRPYEWFASAVRLLALQQHPAMAATGGGIVEALGHLGQVPFGWPPPDDFPDVETAWASTGVTLARWNAVQALVTGAVTAFLPLDVDALVGSPVPATAGALVDHLVERLLTSPARPALRAALLESTGLPDAAPIDQASARLLAPDLAALVLSAPEAQVR